MSELSLDVLRAEVESLRKQLAEARAENLALHRLVEHHRKEEAENQVAWERVRRAMSPVDTVTVCEWNSHTDGPLEGWDYGTEPVVEVPRKPRGAPHFPYTYRSESRTAPQCAESMTLLGMRSAAN